MAALVVVVHSLGIEEYPRITGKKRYGMLFSVFRLQQISRESDVPAKGTTQNQNRLLVLSKTQWLRELLKKKNAALDQLFKPAGA